MVTQQYQSSENGTEVAAQHRLHPTPLRGLLAAGKRAFGQFSVEGALHAAAARVMLTVRRSRQSVCCAYQTVSTEEKVKYTLAHPEEIRLSRSDPAVYLFYTTEQAGRWVCAVAKREDNDGFLITAYPTDAIKEGEKIWPK